MTARILLADDDPGVLDVVAFALEREGFEVTQVSDGDAALHGAQSGDYDVLILDVMMPRRSGIDVCRTVRAASAVPIVMLTARDAELDRVLGLELGADDYITKPFSMAELVSRIRSILRRRELDQNDAGTAVRRIGGLELDLARHCVRVEGKLVRLTPSEFKLLVLLTEQPERVFTRQELMRHLWQSDHVGDEHACDVHISNLRRKIERDPAHPQRIVTVRGFGYQLRPV